jgi:hypothetical protein
MIRIAKTPLRQKELLTMGATISSLHRWFMHHLSYPHLPRFIGAFPLSVQYRLITKPAPRCGLQPPACTVPIAIGMIDLPSSFVQHSCTLISIGTQFTAHLKTVRVNFKGLAYFFDYYKEMIAVTDLSF